VPSTGAINVKQAHALLQAARWLQEKMSSKWIKTGELMSESTSRTTSAGSSMKRSASIPVDAAGVPLLMMVITGGAGAGKTTTLTVIEALADHFIGTASVCKAAPTNTAARLLRGDTLHALYKLPLRSLHGKRGKLSDRVLKQFRQKFKTVEVQILDEISVMAPAHLYQVDVRSRAAKMAYKIVFGGLGNILGGDF